ncbi:DNA modification methylase [Microbacterium sp.]|uniref:DNA modification methylase n=1 Tax=Microbacterium sp. TaxID=51671 RepID=UPI002811D76A|nr:DNA modification methylase [Microbacterium sp.]
MNSRLAASVAPRLAAVAALGAAVVLGTTGCSYLTHQATTIPYSASDGVNVDSTGGPIEVRNAFIVADEDGETGNLVAALVNTGDKSTTLSIDVAGEQLSIRVPAGESYNLGGEEDPLPISDLGVTPGATVEVLFSSGDDAKAVPAQVPVLDGTLPYYSDLTPEPSPSETAGAAG